jgi:hypothetical protein
VSSASPAVERAFLVGGAGAGRLGFAIPLEDVRRLVAADALPRTHRRLSVSRLFGAAADEPHARYAEVDAAGDGAYFEIGEDAAVARVPSDAVEPVPDCLSTAARRWAWAGLLRDGDVYRMVVDVRALAPLAAERRAP